MSRILTKALEWVDDRFPLTKTWNEHLAEYYAPKNFNFWYYFGSLAMMILVIQIVTGIFLTMHYKPDAEKAFASVEYIMRDVPWGWLMRYLHAVGASMFFVVIYLHMFRGLLYGSHQRPRELIWLLGCVIFVALMAEAFMGYLLPWGQMSYWGAQVIISLFAAVPYVGEPLAEWIRGDFVVSDATLNRFFAFHVVALPLILVGLVFMHIVALHKVGSNNPDGIDIKKDKDANGVPKDGIPFHPYYSVKDLVGVVVFLIIYLAVVFFMPEFFGLFLEKDNFLPADSLQTPSDIVPLWYFTPFYSILRATTEDLMWFVRGLVVLTVIVAFIRTSNLAGRGAAAVVGAAFIIATFIYAPKFWGVVLMGLSIVALFLLPWLDRSPVRSIRYRGWMYKAALTVFVISFVILGYMGMHNTSGYDLFLFQNVVWAQICTMTYALFFILMPLYTVWDKTKPEPERVNFK
ncbi:MAG: cytochrome b N-terminal domain-containing protein [Gammaproteobacteria bacterium]|nr:cytochrome b N-terminal domain-containing protein [Gammaproteobacteria bacterium]